MTRIRNEQRNATVFAVIVALSLVIRAVMQLMLPIWARGEYTVDDYLMVYYADTLSGGHWLGGYSMYALNKVPGYSMFLAVCNLSRLPYMLCVGAFYAVSCLIFLVVLRKFIKSRFWSLICFWYLLFSPVMFDDHVAQKLYRQAIIPGLVLMVLSAYMAMYYERKNGFKKLLPWAILAGVCYAFFMIVREDSSWFSCFIFGATVLLAGLYIIEHWKDFHIRDILKHATCLAIPVLCSVLAVNMLCAINWLAYGLYVKNDFNQTNFARVCKLLMTIEPEEELPFVYISHDTLDRAYEASPTFTQMQDAMERRYQNPTAPGLNNGEFSKAMFVWNLRWAANEAGLYADPQTMDSFFGQVADELQTAFDNGTFEPRQALVISPWARPIRDGDYDDILRYSLKGYKSIVTYRDIDVVIYDPTGPESNVNLMQDMTNQTIEMPQSDYRLRGWIAPTDFNETVTMTLYDDAGNEFCPAFLPSEDVYSYYLTNGVACEVYRQCRFDAVVDARGMDLSSLKLRVTCGDDVIYEGAAVEFTTLDDPRVTMSVDDNYLINGTEYGVQRNVKALNLLIRFYQWTAPALAIAALLVFAAECLINLVRLFRRRSTNLSLCLIKFGMLLTVWVNLVVVSINYFETDPHNFREYYAAGVYPIWQVFVCLSLCTVLTYVVPFVKEKAKAASSKKSS